MTYNTLKITAKLTILLLILLIAGCASPSVYLHKEAETYTYQRIDLKGNPFTHVSYASANKPLNKQSLHVYIEGDGVPWRGRFFIASDPTPRSSIVFELMELDKQRSLYLGRPCYLGQATTPPCNSLLWTHKRHSAEVVASMATALRNYLASTPATQITFIGHSGGGALAMLLAPHFPQTKAIVTLGGNLDIDAWTTHHGYTSLTRYGSINPASLPPFPANIQQVHLAAENDTVIPPEMIKTALKNQPTSEYILVKNANHTCCWLAIWPNVLSKLTD